MREIRLVRCHNYSRRCPAFHSDIVRTVGLADFEMVFAVGHLEIPVAVDFGRMGSVGWACTHFAEMECAVAGLANLVDCSEPALAAVGCNLVE